uniref:Golgin A2 n=1 Tax=Gadus morhua TaxID=8049 RepID=A0A8C5A3Z7_GADMO
MEFACSFFSVSFRPLSSTESLRQLSQQLNAGIYVLSYSCVVNLHACVCVCGAPFYDLCFAILSLVLFFHLELSAALDSSHLTNSELNTQLDQLVRSCVCVCERKEFEQKSSKEQGAMREQLQVHIQTIGILVSEKSELQTALQYTQHAARQKAGEADELSHRLQSTKQRMAELERTLSSVSTQQKQFEKHNKDLEKERDSLRQEVYRLNSVSDEAMQQSSELSEQLKLSTQENGAMRLELEELSKRLEMSDLMLQQFSSQSEPSTANQQVQMLLEEKQHLEAHTNQLLESIAQLQTERDRYAEQIQEEGRLWKDKTEQLLTQVTLVAEERDSNINLVQELESQVAELKNAAAMLSQEQQARDHAVPQPSGPSESEVALQEALDRLHQEKEALTEQYQAQLRDNGQLSRLCAEQESRLGELERQQEGLSQETEDRRRMLEDVQSDKATISRALTQNRTLKDQLAELQNGFVKLTNENMELTSAIQSEQHVKKEVARKLGQLQEDNHTMKEQLALKSQESVALLEQRDQVVAHLQQYCAGYQTLASEREQLHLQYLQQAQLMDRLQHDENEGRVQLEISHQQLRHAQKSSPPPLSSSSLLHRNRLPLLSSSPPSPLPPSHSSASPLLLLPPLLSSSPLLLQEQFIRGVVSQLEGERDAARGQLEEERRLHLAARHQASAARALEHQRHQGHLHHDDGVPAEVHEALRGAMDKLQQRFTSLMQEKVDLRERVEELEHRCIQLSGETDTIGEYIALYQSQRAIMKQKHQEKEHYITMLAQDKEEMKAKLSELQDLVMRLVAERDDWCSRYSAVVASGPANPDLLPLGQGHDAMEVIPLTDANPGPDSDPSYSQHHHQHLHPGADPQAAGGPSPQEDGTTRQIMQLLQEIRNPQGASRAPPFLGDSPCIPFFYRPDEQDEVKILVV